MFLFKSVGSASQYLTFYLFVISNTFATQGDEQRLSATPDGSQPGTVGASDLFQDLSRSQTPSSIHRSGSIQPADASGIDALRNPNRRTTSDPLEGVYVHAASLDGNAEGWAGAPRPVRAQSLPEAMRLGDPASVFQKPSQFGPVFSASRPRTIREGETLQGPRKENQASEALLRDPSGAPYVGSNAPRTVQRKGGVRFQNTFPSVDHGPTLQSVPYTSDPFEGSVEAPNRRREHPRETSKLRRFKFLYDAACLGMRRVADLSYRSKLPSMHRNVIPRMQRSVSKDTNQQYSKLEGQTQEEKFRNGVANAFRGPITDGMNKEKYLKNALHFSRAERKYFGKEYEERNRYDDWLTEQMKLFTQSARTYQTKLNRAKAEGASQHEITNLEIAIESANNRLEAVRKHQVKYCESLVHPIQTL